MGRQIETVCPLQQGLLEGRNERQMDSNKKRETGKSHRASAARTEMTCSGRRLVVEGQQSEGPTHNSLDLTGKILGKRTCFKLG